MTVNFCDLALDAAGRLGVTQAPVAEAYELVRFVFGRTRAQIIADPVGEADDHSLAEFNRLIGKRLGGYPLQYIIGEWDFFGHTFSLDENVLIPRTETEQIVDEALSFYHGLSDPKRVVIDMCAGSGCIGLSFAAAAPNAEVFLCDISEGALACAERNRQKLGLSNVRVLRYDLFKGFDSGVLPRPDIFLCNPPYVPAEELPRVQREVSYEPELAVNGGAGGMDFYGALCGSWLDALSPGGFFMFESGEGQPEKILELIDPCVFDARAESDICDIVRFVTGIKR